MRSSKGKLNSIRSFTLTELLIVVAILAVISAAVVLVLNPAEYLAQGRDSQRVSDINSLNTAVGLYASSVRGSKGSVNTVYISIPDTNANCSGISGLPSLPSGWSYSCVTSADSRNSDGTGWLPINLSALPGGSTLDKLPIDPVNNASSLLYYSYSTDGIQWEVMANTESVKIENERATKDGGTNIIAYEAGTKLDVIPDVALGTSCNTIHTAFPNGGTGVYLIDIDGANGSETAIPVYCDMATDGGGWTLVQTTIKGQAVDSRWAASFPTQLNQTIGTPSIDAPYRLAMKYWYMIPNTSWCKMAVSTAEGKPTFNKSPAFSLTGVNAGPTGFIYMGSDPAVTMNSLSSYNWNTCTNGIAYFNTSCCGTCILYNSPSTYNAYNQPMMTVVTAVDGSALQKWNSFVPLNRLNIFSR